MKKSAIVSKLLAESKDAGILTKRTATALEWHRKTVSRIFEGKSWATKTVNSNPIRSAFGQIHLFQYSPKHKDTLPYYDRFPLALFISPSAEGDGILGINFHYLSPTKRAQFMTALYKFEEYFEEQNSSVINVSYSDLVSNYALRYYKPCIKKYLMNHIISNPFYTVPSDEWNMMLFLPTQRFVKATDSKVWRDSAKLAG